jgi:hypothetical protein
MQRRYLGVKWSQVQILSALPADINGPAIRAVPSLLDLRAVNGDWLNSQDFPPLKYKVPDILPEGAGTLIAPPKKGKSFLVGDIGLAVASGGHALGAIPVTLRPVLYLALEDGYRRLRDRFGRIMRVAAIPAGIEVVIQATPGEAPLIIGEYLNRTPTTSRWSSSTNSARSNHPNRQGKKPISPTTASAPR